MELVTYFKSLADETRLRLLNLLLHHELNVNEIVSAMGMGQSRISRHLKILADSGFLTARRDGLWVFYRATGEGKAKGLIDLLALFFDKDDELKRDLSRIERILEEGSREKTRFFDRLAPDWDEIRSEILGSLDIAGEIVNRLQKCETAADIGCGTGELLAAIAKKARRVIGVDRSPNMLDEAERRLKGRVDKYELRLGEIEHLPMREGEADAVTVNMVLHHVVSPVQGISEISRVLKKGGALIIADLEKHSNEEMRTGYGHRWLGFSREEIHEWHRGAGLSIIDERTFSVKKGLTVNIFVSRKK